MHKFSASGAERLERPERYHPIPPAATLRRFGLEGDMHFLDVGAGTGFFSRAALTIVGPSGRVYAAEMSDDMLEAFKRNGMFSNMTLVRSAEYEIPLATGIADLALLAFVLHANADSRRLLDEVLRGMGEGLLWWSGRNSRKKTGPRWKSVSGRKNWIISLNRIRSLPGAISTAHSTTASSHDITRPGIRDSKSHPHRKAVMVP